MRRSAVLLVLVLLGSAVGAEPEYKGKSIPYWKAQATSKTPKDRKAAVEALSALGEAVAVASLLADNEADVRTAAIQVLRKSGTQAVPQLIAEARKGWPGGSPSMDGLVAIGDPAVPDLIRQLRDQEPLVLMGASLTLGRIGPPAKAAIPDLARIGRITGYDSWPGPAIFALAQIDAERKTSVPVVAEAIDSGEAGVRKWARMSLEKIGTKAIPLLIEILQNPHARGRSGAARALGRLGSEAKSALPALKQALNDQDRNIRFEAKFAIEKIEEHGIRKEPKSH